MTGKERRKKLLDILIKSDRVVSGDKLSKMLDVSRQVIVQDISILRASDKDIKSTTRGYYIQESYVDNRPQRIFKVRHTEEQITEEMNIIVDMGGVIEDEFVYHKVYGIVQAKLSIKSRKDVQNYAKSISGGVSRPLMSVTSGYHYHTVVADSEEELDEIQESLDKSGFLAELRNYEPVDFGNMTDSRMYYTS